MQSLAPVPSHVVARVDGGIDEPLRRYGIEQLLRLVGFGVRFKSDDSATIYCGSNPAIGAAAAIWIPPDDAFFLDAGQRPTISLVDGVCVPHRGPAPASLWVGNRLSFDVARATAFWLTLESERYAAARDGHNRVPAAASLLGTLGLLNRPPIHAYVQLLADRLNSEANCGSPLPRWPLGKTFAAALSHDVDAPERSNRVPLYLKEMVFKNHRPRRHAYWDLCAEIRTRGLANACIRPPSRRPEWDFGEICEIEEACGLRSAFYFAVVPRSLGHLCDTTYDSSRSRYRRLYRRLIEGGWEVGLQAGYLTSAGRPSLRLQVDRLARFSGHGIAGVRHHYLQLDPVAPMRTLATHADAGLLYDATVGFNDDLGFRAGIALPYQPYDPQRQGAAPLVELPTGIADMHMPKQYETVSVEAVAEHLRIVRGLGGLALLNWHVGNWHFAPAWRDSYCAACRLLAEDADVWVATPREVATWWRQRSEALQ
ncbi:MAG TPA: hypothetical protein VMV94_11460 [Phycisphaerae bacterium]|nr:hypothetical protein [Phycisphaerae bacterium]